MSADDPPRVTCELRPRLQLPWLRQAMSDMAAEVWCDSSTLLRSVAADGRMTDIGEGFPLPGVAGNIP